MHREHRLTRRARLPDVEHWPHDARAVKRLVPLACIWKFPRIALEAQA